MECISIFDMLKIGIGPSSSHTLGPWRAAERWLKELQEDQLFDRVQEVKIRIYGSLSLTGKGHATDLAIIMGLTGADPEYVAIESIDPTVQHIRDHKKIVLDGKREVPFNPAEAIEFKRDFLPVHANGMEFEAILDDGTSETERYYS
ncbi:MAG: L-serine ammonia-lyase, partial [Flavobacteriaceae bacterium]|nr:L-serine ammonia-lyase [Flavobacteriaceae bacterium]